MRLDVLPLRLHVDQDALEFLVAFFRPVVLSTTVVDEAKQKGGECGSYGVDDDSGIQIWWTPKCICSGSR